MTDEQRREIRAALSHISADDKIHPGDVWKVRTSLEYVLLKEQS